MRLNKPQFLSLILIIYFQVVYAHNDFIDEKYIPATSYSTRDGLPSNNVLDIVQDSKGFLWLATQEGLSRFDSTEFINFSKDKSDSYSLPDLLVEDLILMPDGQLWMSIYEVGITVFDMFTHQSQSIKNTQSSLFQLPNSYLYGIDRDQNNNIWFSIYGEGIYQWKTSEGKFYKHLSTDENAWLTSKKTYEIMVDKTNRLWICSIDSKVFSYDINTGESKIYDFSTDPNDSLSSPIYGFAESNDGEIYAGGFSGVFKYNEITEEFDNIVSKSLISNLYAGERTSVRRLMVDSKDNLWIGTSKSLLQYSKNQLNRIKLYENGAVFEDNWLSHSIVEGRDGNIWIGTEGRGLIKVSSDWERFNIYLSNSDELIDYRGAYQYKDNLWLTHTSSQIDQYQYINGQLILKASLKPNLGSDSIRIDSLYQDEPNILWISSVDGISKFNIITGETNNVTNIQNQKLGFVRLFYRAFNKRFFFYMFTENQMGYFDETDLSAHLIDNTENNSFKGSTVNKMTKGIDGKIWLATDHGIETFDMQSYQFDLVYKSTNNQSISDFYIEKDNQNVWMIADGGLYHLVWNGEVLIKQNDKFRNTLPKVIFDKIKMVENEMLLISTKDNGLVEINNKTLKYNVNTKENGLPSNVIKEVLFPGDTPMVVTDLGIAVYNNNYIEPERETPKIVIDTLRLNGEKIQPKNDKPIELEHDFDSIDFDVALLSYLNSATIEYEYLLEGLNKNWINTGNDDKFSLRNLDDGKYNFKVRGRSNYGNWSEFEQFSFIVKTPPWKSIWAYGLYFSFIMAVIFWLLYLYKRKILYEHEISKQQNQKQIANAASKAKSDFLARVSHEIRTPLNGVLGMGELMLDTCMDEEQKVYADSIMASGHHLLDIINDILDLSKIEAGKLELEYKSFDLLLLVDEIVGVFTSQSKQKNLLFTCVFDEKINRYRIGDIIRIKQILFNLLSNAFKFTNQGEVSLHVSQLEDDNNTIIFSVVDTGSGIDDEFVEELFQPFVQADSAITRKFGGTGLGLAIVKQLVEKMQGKITAKKRCHKGSVFQAQIYLQIDDKIKPKDFEKNSYNVCLLIKQPNLKINLESYLNILNIKHTETLSAETTCVFVEALTQINSEYVSELSKLGQSNIMINFIGFNSDHIDKSLLKTNNLTRVLYPPITFKKIKKIYFDSKALEYKKQDNESVIITSTGLNLLVVEDNVVNQQVSIEMLEKMGHLVDIVDNAEEALIMLNRNKYDMLLLDYHLPMMDGLSLIKVWENKRNIPVIMITADLTDDVMQKCLKLNIDNIVPKPFTQLHLASAIEKGLSQTT